MIMESPVRICLSAVFVVNLLLLCSGIVDGISLPSDINSTTPKDDKSPRSTKLNSISWTPRNHKTPDLSLNELKPKDPVPEQNIDKNAKSVDRGRVRFNTRLRSTTESALRRVRSTTEKTNDLVIVTPTPEVKKPAQIIDSMRAYKRTKLPVVSSSTTPVTVQKENQSVEEYEDKEEEEDKESYEKFTSNTFLDSYFSTIPGFGDDFDSERFNNKEKQSYSSPSYEFFNYLPKDSSYTLKDDNNEPFKSSFFDFDSELTTPQNDFFDKKYQEISSSIIKNLHSITTKPSPTKEWIPNNKSTLLITNTKEYKLGDNEKAGSNNKELSDVQGTSIFYERSVLSTETYAISSDDCDNDTLLKPTASTSKEKELESIKNTPKGSTDVSTKPTPSEETIETEKSSVTSNYIPPASFFPIFNVMSSTPTLASNITTATEKVTRIHSSNFTRSKSYSKRLNFTRSKESPNSVTLTPITSSTNKALSRKFHFTTSRKPVWLRRNLTRISKPTMPTTIYSEYFNIKNKYSTTPKSKPSRTTLTTVSSEIDPVLQDDVSGPKKVVQSLKISDNSIPSLWKRGSMKYSTSTATSAEEKVEMEIPPTSTAWALAGLRSTPSLAVLANATVTQKSIDENELQKVGEVIDKKETTVGSTTTTTANPLSNDIPKKITEVNQNRIGWPVFPTSPSIQIEVTEPEVKLESLPAESNIYVQSSLQPTTESTKAKTKIVKPLWIPETLKTETTTELQDTSETETIPPVDATRSTGFESITKLPADITTPQDETVASSELNQTVTDEKPQVTTDYEITTIRFSYVPTEEVEDISKTQDVEETTETEWHPIIPTRTKATTIKDSPITTYRPKYMSTTDFMEEMTTEIMDTTPVLEVSSQIISKATEKEPPISETPEQTTFEIETEIYNTSTETTEDIVVTTPSTTTTTMKIIPSSTTPETTSVEDSTSIVTEVVTEISMKQSRKPTTDLPTTETNTKTETPYGSVEDSKSNEVITPDVKVTTSTTTEAATESPATIKEVITEPIVIDGVKDKSTENDAKIYDTTSTESYETTKAVNNLEDITSYHGEMTTEASSRTVNDEEGSGAAVAIAVSTIGVIALILLIGLLLVVRRRGRRGVYAQRCTPVSLDAYSLDSVSVGHRKGNHRLRASKRSYGNPAYDDEVTSHPMQYPALASFAQDGESMVAEFTEIPSVTVRPDEVPPGCEDKNRYSNVLPLPETRVPLRRLGNDATTEYINANYITGPGNIKNYYIASQAPMANTVGDFWRMVWEQNSRLIVMLTEYMENGVEKCYEYLPPSEISDNKRIFSEFKVILKKREQRDKYAICSVQLLNLTTRTWREVTHLWYFWPAKGVPDDFDSIIDFMSEMRSYMKVSQGAKEYDEEGVEVIYGENRSSFNNLSKLKEEGASGNGINVYSPAKAEEQMRRGAGNNGTLGRMKAASEIEGIRPCVVTCASGAGRSAALIALDICARALAAGSCDVPRVVRQLRAQRPHSLSNRHHYIFLYKVLSEYGNKLMGGGVDTI